MGKEVLNTVVGVAGAIASYMFGGWSAVLELLLILTVLDYLSGMAAATIEQKLNSATGFKGIIKKITIFAIVFVCHKLDAALELDNWLMNVAAFFYISNECLSLIENAGRIGVPVPDQLTKAVEALKDRGNKSA
jgi:toxin secretion/phage lysis holin